MEGFGQSNCNHHQILNFEKKYGRQAAENDNAIPQNVKRKYFVLVRTCQYRSIAGLFLAQSVVLFSSNSARKAQEVVIRLSFAFLGTKGREADTRLSKAAMSCSCLYKNLSFIPNLIPLTTDVDNY